MAVSHSQRINKDHNSPDLVPRIRRTTGHGVDAASNYTEHLGHHPMPRLSSALANTKNRRGEA